MTAALIQQYPTRFDGALPMCGVISGGVGLWNSFLDTAFTFNELLAGAKLQVVNILDPGTDLYNAETIIASAQNTAQGQARIALAAALGNVPGWYTTGSPKPAPTDYADQEANQFLWLQQDEFLFDFSLRAELEGRAGGNPSWNTGVNYREKLKRSADRAEVTALYAQAGLSLDADLASLDSQPKIVVNPPSLTYLSDNIIFDGQISVPVLTLQTEGDGLVVPETDSAYEEAVRGAGDAAGLRRTFVERAGHCAFTPGETIAAFQALMHRVNTGRWSGIRPGILNAVALALGQSYNPAFPSYVNFAPGPYLRPYNGTPPQPKSRR